MTPEPGYCRNCITERLHGNYYGGLCGNCLARVPAGKRDQLLRALSAQAQVKQEAPRGDWRPT